MKPVEVMPTGSTPLIEQSVYYIAYCICVLALVLIFLLLWCQINDI